jgi:hypothetical protein
MAPEAAGVVQLALAFGDWHADDVLAGQIAEALWVLHALVVGSMLDTQGITAYRVPDGLLSGTTVPSVRPSRVIKWDRGRPSEERWGRRFHPGMPYITHFDPSESWAALHAVPVAMESPSREALHFYGRSVARVARLVNPPDQATVESAFADLYKSVEILAGEPMSEVGHRQRLIDVGIDPDDVWGDTEKLPIIRWLRGVQKLQDRLERHAYPPIDYPELANAQEFVRACLLQHLRSRQAFVAHDSFRWSSVPPIPP